MFSVRRPMLKKPNEDENVGHFVVGPLLTRNASSMKINIKDEYKEFAYRDKAMQNTKERNAYNKKNNIQEIIFFIMFNDAWELKDVLSKGLYADDYDELEPQPIPVLKRKTIQDVVVKKKPKIEFLGTTTQEYHTEFKRIFNEWVHMDTNPSKTTNQLYFVLTCENQSWMWLHMNLNGSLRFEDHRDSSRSSCFIPSHVQEKFTETDNIYSAISSIKQYATKFMLNSGTIFRQNTIRKVVLNIQISEDRHCVQSILENVQQDGYTLDKKTDSCTTSGRLLQLRMLYNQDNRIQFKIQVGQDKELSKYSVKLLQDYLIFKIKMASQQSIDNSHAFMFSDFNMSPAIQHNMTFPLLKIVHQLTELSNPIDLKIAFRKIPLMRYNLEINNVTTMTNYCLTSQIYTEEDVKLGLRSDTTLLCMLCELMALLKPSLLLKSPDSTTKSDLKFKLNPLDGYVNTTLSNMLRHQQENENVYEYMSSSSMVARWKILEFIKFYQFKRWIQLW